MRVAKLTKDRRNDKLISKNGPVCGSTWSYRDPNGVPNEIEVR